MSNTKLQEWWQKNKKKMPEWIRLAVQIVFFIWFPSAFTAAFSGVRYIAVQIGAGERIAMTSFVQTLVALCVFTILFGRFFCGYACAFGSLGDLMRMIYVSVCRKRKKKAVTFKKELAAVLSAGKYIVLFGILILCYLQIYGNVHGSSPWEVFSMLHAGNFRLGEYAVGIVLLLLILVGMCVQERFFCRFLCPMGAVFSMLPVLGIFTLQRDRANCIPGCAACSKKCPADLGLPQEGSWDVPGDCVNCQKCIGTCPRGNIHCGVKKLRGNEIWFTLVRTVLLFAAYLWLAL